MEKKYHNFAAILKNLRTQRYGTEEEDLLRKDLAENEVLLS